MKRRARHELYAWAQSLTNLPLIAGGDITGPAAVAANPALFAPVCGLMLGRIAAVQPWIFAAWQRPVVIDHAEVWLRLFDYTCEDFKPAAAICQMKIVSKYYARNFEFGHQFHVAVQNAPTLAVMRKRAESFFAGAPAVNPEPSVMGL